MSAYRPPPAARSTMQTPAPVAYVAGGLGVLMFIWGFLKWLKLSGGGENAHIGGYAWTSPAPAAIGFCLSAGLLAALNAWQKRPPTLAPLAFSATGLLLVIAIFIGKGSFSEGVLTSATID